MGRKKRGGLGKKTSFFGKKKKTQGKNIYSSGLLCRAREGSEAAVGDRRASCSRKVGKEAPAGGSPALPFRCHRWESHECKEANSPLQFLHLKFLNRSVCLLCVWLVWRRIGKLSQCSKSVWASWFPLATVTAVGNALLWPNLQQTKAQKANPMILKARIVNTRDDFIVVDRIVQQNVLKGPSLWSKINWKKEQFKFIKTVMWFYNDLILLHTLRRANPPQSNDQRETESISCQAWYVFVTVWHFTILAGQMRNLTEETLPSCQTKLQRVALSHFGAYCCLKKLYTKPDRHDFLHFNPCRDETIQFLQRCPKGILLSFCLPAVPFWISKWSAE